MNAEKMNSWLSILANVGVLVGIVFLAVELQQNTDVMKAQTRDTVTQKQVDWFREMGTDPNAIKLLRKGTLDHTSLDEDEYLAFYFMTQAVFRMWENELYQYNMGLFEEAEFLPRIDRWRTSLSPGRQFVWSGVRNGYSPEFRELIDQFAEGE